MKERELQDVQRQRLIEDCDRLNVLILRVARGETKLKQQRDVLEQDVWRRMKAMR